jgi:hypothetical protein
MKEPITREPIEITVSQPRMGTPYRAKAAGLSATSDQAYFAARNLAVRHFFGGYTKAHGVGPKEFEAIEVTEVGPGRFRAALREVAA